MSSGIVSSQARFLDDGAASTTFVVEAALLGAEGVAVAWLDDPGITSRGSEKTAR
jgi:hypothetical protein